MKKAYGVSVLIIKDGLILAVARRDNPNDYGMPGGKRELNETEMEAATREILEETGLTITNLKEVNRRNCGADEAVTFTADWTGTPSTQPGEPECAWKEPKELMRGPFGEYNTYLFKKMGIV